MKRVLRHRSSDAGAEVVEFAIVVPLFIGLFLGLVGFAFVLMAQITVTQAAREGARAAAICNTSTSCLGSGDANVKAAVVNHAPGVTINTANVTVGDCTASGTTNASVTVAYDVSVSIPPFGNAISFTVHGKAYTPCGG